jgi:hypothetical protein
MRYPSKEHPGLVEYAGGVERVDGETVSCQGDSVRVSNGRRAEARWSMATGEGYGEMG